MQETCVQSLGPEDPLEEGNQLKYSCLDKGDWWVIIHVVTKESDTTHHMCMHAHTHIPTHRLTPGGACVKNSACQCRRHKRCGFDLWARKIPWRRARQSIPACLENPMDRGVGWAIVQGVPKRWTQLGMHTQRLTTFSIRHIIQKVGSPFCHPHKVVLFQISVWAIEIQRNGDALQTWLRHF